MIGTTLKTLREQHGLNQGELAKKVGKSQETISSWETGRTVPRMKDIQTLCKIYDCTYESITGIRQHNSDDITVDDILLRMNTLSNDDLEKIRKQLDQIALRYAEIDRINKEKAALEEQLLQYQIQLNSLSQNTNTLRGSDGE